MKADRKKLYLAMARACIKTSELSALSDVPKPTVTNVISGRNVRPDTLGKITRALKVDVLELVGGEPVEQEK